MTKTLNSSLKSTPPCVNATFDWFSGKYVNQPLKAKITH